MTECCLNQNVSNNRFFALKVEHFYISYQNVDKYKSAICGVLETNYNCIPITKYICNEETSDQLQVCLFNISLETGFYYKFLGSITRKIRKGKLILINVHRLVKFLFLFSFAFDQ